MNHLSDVQLNEYLDGVLAASAHQEIEMHLSTCNKCQARLEELEHVFSSLEALEEKHLPRDLTASVLERLPYKTPRSWTPAFAAQLGAALGALLWLSWQISRTFEVPTLSTFQRPRLSVPEIIFLLPAFNLPHLSFSFQWLIPHFAFSLPSFPAAPFSASSAELALIGIAAFLIWLGSNAVLLYNQTEHKR